MEVSKICRFCLGSNDLRPIFYDNTKQNRISTAIFITTGIKVDENDGSPQQLCVNCTSQLNNSLKFRKRCRKINIELCKYMEEIKKGNSNGYGFKIVNINSSNIKNEFDDEIKKENLDEDDIPLSNLIDNYIPDENNSEFCEIEIEDIKMETNFIQKDENAKKNVEITINLAGKHRINCIVCSKSLSYRSMAAHMDLYHPGTNGRVKCDLCDKYLIKYKLNRHMKLMHGIQKGKIENNTLKCGYCKEKFNTKEVLLAHTSTCPLKKKKRTVYNREKEISKCDICHKTMQQASLRMHKAIKHAGLGPVCQHCGKKFGNKFRLQEHCRAKHGYDKFKCSSCDFQTASALSLKNHERRHKGEKPFQCETCGAKFHAAYLLSQHKQSHRPEKNFKCDQCSATFKVNNALHMHKSTCHSKCSYRCFLCDRTYNCRHYVVKHLRHFHDFKDKVGVLEKVYEVKNSDGTKVIEEL